MLNNYGRGDAFVKPTPVTAHPPIPNGIYFIRTSRRSTNYVYLCCKLTEDNNDDEVGIVTTAKEDFTDPAHMWNFTFEWKDRDYSIVNVKHKFHLNIMQEPGGPATLIAGLKRTDWSIVPSGDSFLIGTGDHKVKGAENILRFATCHDSDKSASVSLYVHDPVKYDHQHWVLERSDHTENKSPDLPSEPDQLSQLTPGAFYRIVNIETGEYIYRRDSALKMWHLKGYESDNSYAFQLAFTRHGGVILMNFRDVPTMGDPFYVDENGTATKLYSAVDLAPVRGRDHTFHIIFHNSAGSGTKALTDRDPGGASGRQTSVEAFVRSAQNQMWKFEAIRY